MKVRRRRRAERRRRRAEITSSQEGDAKLVTEARAPRSPRRRPRRPTRARRRSCATTWRPSTGRSSRRRLPAPRRAAHRDEQGVCWTRSAGATAGRLCHPRRRPSRGGRRPRTPPSPPTPVAKIALRLVAVAAPRKRSPRRARSRSPEDAWEIDDVLASIRDDRLTRPRAQPRPNDIAQSTSRRKPKRRSMINKRARGRAKRPRPSPRAKNKGRGPREARRARVGASSASERA